MKGIELYKFVGAILAAALLVQVARIAGNHLVAPEPAAAPPVAAAEEPAVEVAEAEAPTEPEPAAEAAAEAPGEPQPPEQVAARAEGIAALLATADPNAAKGIVKKCAPCHSFEKGGPKKIGPPLWEVVGSEKAAHAGFKYSDGFAALEGTWSYDELDVFLADPKALVPGTKMLFPGIKKPKDRANVIAYLRTLSDEPEPLP